MSFLQSKLQGAIGTAQGRLSTQLYRLGYTPKSLEEAQRDVLWWTYARVQAGLNLRPLLSGSGIAFTGAGYAELVPIDTPRAGRGRVTVEVTASSVSPGTERAQYLHLPNAQLGVLGRPGYSVAGHVRHAGAEVDTVQPGQLVAVTGVPHASVVTASQDHVFAVPPGVPAEQAAMIMLGTICTHGADVAAVQPGERVAVIGAGPIGILAFRIACVAGVPAAVVAQSDRGRNLAAASGAPLLSAMRNSEQVAALDADVVIEATGDPQAIATAVAAARAGGRIVLLGSPRGITREFPVDEIKRKRLQLIGAHVDTLDLIPGGRARRQAGERFLGMLAAERLLVADLVGPAVDPRRASGFYRELAQRSAPAGAYFDWTLLDPDDRVTRGHLFKPPNVAGRGMEASQPLRPRRRRAGSPLGLDDPLADAKGRLRIGLLGCGDIAVHNASGAAGAPNVEIAACFDPVTRLADDLAARYGARVARTQAELLDSPDVDAVLLSVPHDLHAPLALEACQAGKNVIVEKPLAHSLADAVEMCDAARRNGVWLSTCFPQRYEPKVQIARALIANGAIGSAEGTLTRVFLDKSPAYWLGGFSGRSQSDWRQSRERAGGGVLIMNLSHHLDLMRYLSGLDVEAASAACEPPDEIEETCVANLRYAGGALGSLIGASSVRGSTEEGLSLWGSDGRIVIEPQPRVYTMSPFAGIRTTRWHSFGRLSPAPLRTVYLTRLATAVSEGRAPEITGEDGLAVQAIIEAVYRSASEDAVFDPQELIENVRRPAVAAL